MNLPGGSKRKWLLVILAGALALRVAALGGDDLWTDEIQTLHAVRLGVPDLVAERLRAGHLPLYFLLEKSWCSVFGTSQAAIRAPSAIFGVLLLLPAWSLFSRVADERAAWTGTALLAAHPLFVELSREARMYSFLGFVALVAADRAVAALDGERPGASFWIAAAIGPLVHPTWGVAMLPFAAWLALERRTSPPGTRLASRAALAGLAASLGLLAVSLAFADPQHQELARRPWAREAGVFLLRMIAGSDLDRYRDLLPRLGFVIIWAAALTWGFVLANGRERRFAAWIGAGVPAVSLAAGLLGGIPWGPARYVQFGAIGLVLLAAIALRPHFPAGAAPFVLICLMASIDAVSTERTAWSEAAERVRNIPLPVVVDDESSRIVLSHYLGRDVFVGSPPPGAGVWRRARLVVGERRRRVSVAEERSPG